MLGTAAALDLDGTSFEPALMATGRASLALRLRLAAPIVQIGLLAALLPTYGVRGAAIATLAASIIGLILFGVIAWRVIYRQRVEINIPAPSA